MLALLSIDGVPVSAGNEELRVVVPLEEVFPFPGLPSGIVGLVAVDERFVPLVDRRLVVEGEHPAQQASARMAAVLLLEGEPFAVEVSDVVSLDETDEAHPENTLRIDCARIWEKIDEMNGGKR